jgi:hypothetical protein
MVDGWSLIANISVQCRLPVPGTVVDPWWRRRGPPHYDDCFSSSRLFALLYCVVLFRFFLVVLARLRAIAVEDRAAATLSKLPASLLNFYNIAAYMSSLLCYFVFNCVKNRSIFKIGCLFLSFSFAGLSYFSVSFSLLWLWPMPCRSSFPGLSRQNLPLAGGGWRMESQLEGVWCQLYGERSVFWCLQSDGAKQIKVKGTVPGSLTEQKNKKCNCNCTR